MRRPPRPQDNGRDDVDKHHDDNNDHCRAVETNAGESDGANEIEGYDIEEAYEIE